MTESYASGSCARSAYLFKPSGGLAVCPSSLAAWTQPEPPRGLSTDTFLTFTCSSRMHKLLPAGTTICRPSQGLARCSDHSRDPAAVSGSPSHGPRRAGAAAATGCSAAGAPPLSPGLGALPPPVQCPPVQWQRLPRLGFQRRWPGHRLRSSGRMDDHVCDLTAPAMTLYSRLQLT